MLRPKRVRIIVFRTVSLIVICLFMLNDAAFSLSPASRFTPIVSPVWDDAEGRYIIIEDTEEVSKLRPGLKEDAAFLYLNSLISGFLRDAAELKRLGMSEEYLRDRLERLKSAIEKDLPHVDAGRFQYKGMWFEENMVRLPYIRKDSSRNAPVTQILKYYLAGTRDGMPEDAAARGSFADKLDKVRIPTGVEGLDVILEDPLAHRTSSQIWGNGELLRYTPPGSDRSYGIWLAGGTAHGKSASAINLIGDNSGYQLVSSGGCYIDVISDGGIPFVVGKRGLDIAGIRSRSLGTKKVELTEEKAQRIDMIVLFDDEYADFAGNIAQSGFSAKQCGIKVLGHGPVSDADSWKKIKGSIESAFAPEEKHSSSSKEAERRRDDVAILAHQRFKAGLDAIDAMIYVADMETHEVLYVNEHAREVLGDVEGKKCWSCIQSDQTGPCEFCTNKKLLDDKGEPTGVHRWQFQNTKTGRWFDCHDVAIRWIDGRLVRMETAIDITEQKAAEGKKQEFAMIAEQAADGIAMADMTGNIVFTNNAWGKMHGYVSGEDLTGKHLSIFHTAEQLTNDVLPFNEMLRLKGTNRGEVGHMRKDGTVFPVRMTTTLLTDDTGKPYGMAAFAADITEEKKAELYKDLLRDVLKILNKEGGFEDALQRVLLAVQKVTECEAAGIRMKDNDDFPYFAHHGFSDDFLLVENQLASRDRDGGLCRDPDGNICLECTCGLVISGKTDPSNPLFTAGGSAWVNDSLPFLDVPADEDPRFHPRNRCIHDGYRSIALIPVRSKGNIVGLLQLNGHKKDLFTLPDIEALEDIAVHIGEAIMYKKAGEEIEQAKLAAEKANKFKSIFLSNMSHEIRTPLNPIVGFTGLIINKLRKDGHLVAEVDEWAGLIKMSAEHLLDLVNDVLEISKIEAGMLELEYKPVQISKILTEMFNSLSLKASSKELNYQLHNDIPPDLEILGDNVRIKQIVMNLLNNAIKFTPKNDTTAGSNTVSLHLGVESMGGQDNLVISVRDTGAGISREEIGVLFEEFSQTRSGKHQDRTEGTGLGLALSWKLAQLMGGDITVESEVGEGSTFTFTFPARRVKPAPQGQRKSFSTEDASILDEVNIIVAEDDAVNQMLLKAVLAPSKPFMAKDGLELLRELSRRVKAGEPLPDVILLDMMMPVMGGEDVLRFLFDEAGRKELTASLKDLEEKDRELLDGLGEEDVEMLRGIPVIIQTADVLDNKSKKYLDMGAKRFLSKPINRQEMISVIGEVAESSSSRGSATREHKEASDLLKEDDMDAWSSDDNRSGFVSQEGTSGVGVKASDSPEKLEIIVAEDDATNQMLLEFFLDPSKPFMAKDGLELLRELSRRVKAGEPLPDVILLDMMMPVMGGEDVLRFLFDEAGRKELTASLKDLEEKDREFLDGLGEKEVERIRKVPIIMQTANVLDDRSRICLELGACGFISKPINRPELLEQIRSVTQKARVQDKELPVPKISDIDVSAIGQAFIDEALWRAREAKKTDQSVIIGLDDSWIPDFQRNTIQLLLNHIHRLSRYEGLDNILFVRGEGDDLAGNISGEIDKSEKDGRTVPLSNIIVLGSEKTIASDKFSTLRSTETEDRAFLVEVNPERIQSDEFHYVAIVEMITFAMKRAFDPTAVSDSPFMEVHEDPVYRRVLRIIPLPPTERIDAQELREIYNNLIKIISAA